MLSLLRGRDERDTACVMPECGDDQYGHGQAAMLDADCWDGMGSAGVLERFLEHYGVSMVLGDRVA